MGEGRGIVVLETYEHAKSRGAKIYAEIIGYGLSGDAYHITAPAEDGDGALRCMNAAIKRAGISAAEIDYINAHGTSTPLGDEIELGAVHRLVGNAAARMCMSSTKSSIGHLWAPRERSKPFSRSLPCAMAVAPPTINLDNPRSRPRWTSCRIARNSATSTLFFPIRSGSAERMRRWYFAASRLAAARARADKALPYGIRIGPFHYGCASGLPIGECSACGSYLWPYSQRNVGGSVGRFRWDAIADRHTRVLPSAAGRGDCQMDAVVAAMVGVEVGGLAVNSNSTPPARDRGDQAQSDASPAPQPAARASALSARASDFGAATDAP
jgi:hypothetical protein